MRCSRSKIAIGVYLIGFGLIASAAAAFWSLSKPLSDDDDLHDDWYMDVSN